MLNRLYGDLEERGLVCVCHKALFDIVCSGFDAASSVGCDVDSLLSFCSRGIFKSRWLLKTIKTTLYPSVGNNQISSHSQDIVFDNR